MARKAAEPRTKGKRTSKKNKDGPKRNKSAYLFFCQDKRADVKKEHPDLKMTEVSKKLAILWKDIGEADKKKYNKMAEEDKKRYEKEKNESGSSSSSIKKKDEEEEEEEDEEDEEENDDSKESTDNNGKMAGSGSGKTASKDSMHLSRVKVNGKELIEIGKMRYVQLSEFRGNTTIDIREYYKDKSDDQLKPGKKGIALTTEQYNNFKQLMPEIDAKLKAID